MKKTSLLLSVMAFCALCTINALAQDHPQPCHGQDTSHEYKVKNNPSIAIAVSNTNYVAVAGHTWASNGNVGTVRIWNNLTRFMMGLRAYDSVHVTAPEGLVYDNSGNLYVVQTQRADSNILIYNSSLHLIKVISNSAGTPFSWFNPRGVALDSAQNLYVISGDSVTTTGANVPNTGKLIKVTSPLSTATKSVLLTGLNAPKAVAIDDNALYVSEFANNKLSRYNLATMVKADSVSVTKPMDLYTTGCRLYCTEHDSNSVKVYNAYNLAGGVIQRSGKLDAAGGPLGIALDGDQDLLICDSNRVLYYSDSEGATDTDYIPPPITSSSGGRYYPYSYYCLGTHLDISSDSERHGTWSTTDTAGIAIIPDLRYDSLVHVYGITTGTFTITYSWSSDTELFSVTITSATISPYITFTDSSGTGTWYSYDTDNVALAHTFYDSVIHVYGLRQGGGWVFNRHGSIIDSFVAGFDSLVVADSIYTWGNSGNIYGSYRFCIDNIVQLLDDAATGDEYWSISDTSIALIDEASGILWPLKAGTATVTYTVVGPCGSSSATFGITIDSDASAGIITGRNMVCIGSHITLIDTVIGGTWINDFPTIATIAASTGDSIHVYGATTGNDNIEYYINNTCADTLYQSVSALARPNAGTISSGSDLCYGTTTTLTAAGADTSSTGHWLTSSPSIIGISGTDSIGIATAYYTAGTALISFVDTNACGSDTASAVLTVDPYPYAGTISGPSTLCQASSATYSSVGAYSGGYSYWSVSDASIATVTSSGVVTGLSSGAVYISYFNVDYCGTAIATFLVIVTPLPEAGIISGPSSVCAGSSITLTDTATTGSWNATNSLASVSSTGTVHGSTAGIDTIFYVVSNSCGVDTTRVPITINPLPDSGTISGASYVCPGSPVTLHETATGGIWTSNSLATISSGGVVTEVAPGIDTIMYTSTTACGTEVTSHIMSVVPVPDAGSISGSTWVCPGFSIYMTDTATMGAWHATNGNATVSSSGEVTGVTAGTDTIFYAVTNACGTNTSMQIVTIYPVPDSGTISGASYVCPGSPVTLSETTTSGTWSASNGHATISSGGVVTEVSPGIDTIFYTTATYCGTVTATHIMFVVPIPDAGSISGDTMVCIDASIVLSETVRTGSWSATNSNATISSGTVTGRTVGRDTIFYSVSNACGGNSTAVFVNINPLPDAGAIYGATYVCSGSPVTLHDTAYGGTWSVTNSLATISAGGVVTEVSPGVDTVFYTSATTYCGSAVASYVITSVATPDAGSISGPTTVCVDGSVTLTDTASGGTWWASNTNDSISASGIITGMTAGLDTMHYRVTNICGSSTATYIITTHPLPNAGTITGSAFVCPGAPVTLHETASGGTWIASNGLATVSTGGVVTAVSPGIDTISYSDTTACGTAFVSHAITVTPNPVAGIITGPSSVCPGGVVTMADTASGGTWSMTNGLATNSGDAVTGHTAGVDTVVYTVVNLCGTAVARYPITINPSVTPAVSIAVTHDTICGGDTVTFTPTPVNGGATPAYTWKKFTTTVGTGSTLTYAPAHGDVIKCVMLSDAICAVPDTAVSAGITMLVNPTVTPTDTISCSIGDSIRFLGQIITLNSEISYCGSPATYQWYLDGSPISGATSITYSTPVYANDTFYCINTCTTICASRLIDTSNTIVIYGSYLSAEVKTLHQSGGNLTLSPNPNNGSFTFTGTVDAYATATVYFDVLDMAGKLLYSNTTVPENGRIHAAINTANVAAGQYILRVITENNVEFVHFVVER